MVERQLSRSRLSQREHGGDQDRVVLIATVGDERTVLEVDAVDRGEHRSGDRRGGQWGGKAGEQQRSAARLSDARGRRMRLARAQPELLEEPRSAVDPMPAEPSEELLGPVPDEEATDSGA